jgi:hypothetical protein
LGAIIYGDRPDDPQRIERIKDVLSSAGSSIAETRKTLRWLAGGGLALWLVLWGMSDNGPWGLLNKWLNRTWEQTDKLTLEVQKVAPALVEVAAAQRESNELLKRLVRDHAGDQAKPEPKPFTPRPVPAR